MDGAVAGGWRPLRVLGAPGGRTGALAAVGAPAGSGTLAAPGTVAGAGADALASALSGMSDASLTAVLAGAALGGVLGAGGAAGTGGVLGAGPGADAGWLPSGPGLDLALPSASATAGTLYAPRGVLLDRDGDRTRVIAADTGNHRLLVWPDLPGEDGADGAVVVGQPDPLTEGPQAGGRGPERGLHLPTGLTRAGDLLVVADAWNHRLLGFDAALDRDDPAPTWVFGQDDLAAVGANRGGDPDAASLYWPFGVLWHDGWLWVADTGNRRVLGWQGLPHGRRPADVVLGQPDPSRRGENRDGEPTADSFRWPHQLAVLDGVLWVADAGNHRLLGWRLPLTGDRPADRLLGQRTMTAAFELPHVPQGPSRLRFPYAVAASGSSLLVADTANNRVLGWSRPDGPAADAVLGQRDFDRAGENRWTAVAPDTLCWPYGLSAVTDPRYGELLGIADSGNNRVVVWHRP